MTRTQRRRYANWHMVMWRLYYAMIIAASGFAMFGVSMAQHHYVLALGVSVLTVGAVVVLLLFTFRRRKPRQSKVA